MKAAIEVSSAKLRGGFYTPDNLVRVCYDRIESLLRSDTPISVLEPSIGDGAFIRGLISHGISVRIGVLFGLEIVEEEAYKARSISHNAKFPVKISVNSCIDWAVETEDLFDAVVGNPPFVRYQFVSKDDLLAIEALGKRIGMPFRGVSNLWIPVLLGALSRLRVGGAMAFVVPAEIFTGLSAGDVRKWLLSHFADLQVDMFLPGSFPEVLQEVVIISGIKKMFSSNQNIVRFVDHNGFSVTTRRCHEICNDSSSWTKYLLTSRHLKALEEVSDLTNAVYLGDIAKIEVSIVTGANDYFSVNNDEVEQYRLQPWIRPLLPRIRHAEGLVYSAVDQVKTVQSGVKAWLLDFDAKKTDPILLKASREYIEIGERIGLHTRYKTSIRKPWYRVPGIWAGKLMLSKRSHWYPRLVLNEAGALTTDTIYRGRLTGKYVGYEKSLVAVFHNSFTLLTAEIEGRSFGGGVLELVPSEVARLQLPFVINLDSNFELLDKIARVAASNVERQNALVERTNQLLTETIPGMSSELFETLEEARQLLAKRRFSRN